MDYLKKIENQVQHFAEVISEALHIECEILSSSWEVVGSTGVTFHGNLEDWNEENAQISSYVFRTKKPLILNNPGENLLCEGCTEKDNCYYKAGLYYPILLEDQCYGIISLAAFTEEERQNMLLNSFSYTKFTGNMADILASKVQEQIAQETINKTNEYLQTIISSVHEGIIACDEQGVITCFNEAAQKISGISAAMAIGRPLEAVVPNSLLLQALRHNQEFAETEIQYHAADGTPVNLISNVSLVKQGDTILGAVESFNTDQSLFRIAHKLMNQDMVASFSNIIGESAAIKEVKLRAAAVAKSPSTVLITGESGTGKELFARAIHQGSLRSNAPFIPVNCSAIPDTLLESELFGYEGGSFTGAKSSGKPGLFEMASGGTIFLDEIGDMPMNLQVKILRVLQEKTIQHIGGTKEIPVDVRIIAATNQNLHQKMLEGTFREDLYYRLNVIPITIPALRERSEDIPLLVNFLCQKYSTILGHTVDSITEEALSTLLHYPWPGNVRELENTIEYAINYTFEQNTIDVAALPKWIRTPDTVAPRFSPLTLSAAEAEKKQLADLLAAKGSSVSAKKEIAASLHISLATLYRKLKKYGFS